MHNHIHIKPLFKRLRSAMVKMSEFFSISIAIVCVVFCLFAVVVVFCCSFFFGGGGGRGHARELSPQSSVFDNVISTKISCAGPICYT